MRGRKGWWLDLRNLAFLGQAAIHSWLFCHCEEGIMDWFYLVSSTVFSLRTSSGLGSEPVFKQIVEFE